MKSNVLCFVGSDHKVGTTMVSQSIAEYISYKFNYKKILLIFLESKDSSDFINVKYKGSISTLKANIQNRVLHVQELNESIHRIRQNLYILKGNESYIDQRFYYPEDIEYIINICEKQFDLIIIDGGSNFDLGLTIGALLYSDKRYLVTTQLQATLDKYTKVRKEILSRLYIEKFNIIVNKYIDENLLMSERDIEKNYHNRLLGTIPYVEDSLLCDIHKTTLLNKTDNIDYNNNIDSISKRIIADLKNDWVMDEALEKSQTKFKKVLLNFLN